MYRSNFYITLIAMSCIMAHATLSMDPPQPKPKTVREELKSRGISFEEFEKMVRYSREGYTAQQALLGIDEPITSRRGEFALVLVDEYVRDEAHFAQWGYRYCDVRDGSRAVEFIPIDRTPEDIQLLRSWGFTDDDIRRLSIASIRDPLNDERLLRAAHLPLNRSDIGSFYIFLSQILYPTATLASEADMLLLIPIYLRIAPETVNAHLREFTPLSLAAFNNYLRAATLLLAAEQIDVNDNHAVGTPLENAIERGHEDMVRLLLTHPKIEITDRAEQLAQKNVAIQRIIERHKTEKVRSTLSNHGAAAIAGMSGNFAFVIPMPHFEDPLLRKYQKDRFKKGVGFGSPSHQEQSRLGYWFPKCIAAGAVAAAAYVAKLLLSPEKKDEKSK